MFAVALPSSTRHPSLFPTDQLLLDVGRRLLSSHAPSVGLYLGRKTSQMAHNTCVVDARHLHYSLYDTEVLSQRYRSVSTVLQYIV